jgi:uncharacterized membrane protein YhfC
MLVIAYVVNFLGMILLPVFSWIYFARKFKLSWKLLLAGGLTFIASQIPHIPLVLALTPTFQSWGLPAFAAALGILAGIFEETSRYILFRRVLKKSRSWSEGVFVGLGHGGTEAFILGLLAAVAFINLLVYRNIDLSTIPSIPASQLELARQQVDAYWSAPLYVALLGMIERLFAICLHVALSVMVLYAIANNRPIWFWIAVVWHATVDGLAVFLGGHQIGPLAIEGVIGLFAIVSLWVAFSLRIKFPDQKIESFRDAEATT